MCFLFTFFTNSLFPQKICFSNKKKFQIDLNFLFVAETNFLRKKCCAAKEKYLGRLKFFFMKLQQFEKFVAVSRKSRSGPQSFSDCENINSVNPVYLIIGDVDGYIEESNGKKCLTFFFY